MTRDTVKLIAALGLAGLGIFGMMSGGAIERPPGVLVDREPLQLLIEEPRVPFGEFELEPRARFEIDARVLSVESYRFDDGAKLAPLDLAVGWGPMSDSDVLAHFRIHQGGRFFTIYPDENAIDLDTALISAANLHIIPANDSVLSSLKRVRAGHVVYLRGRLVNAHGPNGYVWNTSLSRTDTGAGACELFLVEYVERR